ncbi:hypothetical protein BDQ17DRAFT_1366434 [Cyathus striatus]|nr:hypothetical protein BDQ17DRAFT_1366434 [Cyathus striatus]
MKLEFDPSIPPEGYFTPVVQECYLAQHYWSAAAYMFLIWEYVCTCPYEFCHIWRRPITKVKALYLFSRYFGLLFQSANHVIIMRTLSRLPVPSSTCLHWFKLQLVAFIFLFFSMEAVIMLRVYALYNHSKAIGFTLVALLSLELGTSIGCPASIMPKFKFDAICTSEIAPFEIFIYGGSVLFVQLAIAVLTVAKRNAAETSVDSKIIRIVLRDGLWVFAVVTAILSLLVPYSFVKQVAFPYILFSWPISMFSFITCRVIVNLHNIKVEKVYQQQLPQRFTGRSPSEIELPPIMVSGGIELADLNL